MSSKIVEIVVLLNKLERERDLLLTALDEIAAIATVESTQQTAIAVKALHEVGEMDD